MTCPLALVPEAEDSVWPEVPAGADVLNIGTSPYLDDVLVGRPFTGPSGKLVRHWLSQTGLLERSGFVNVEFHRTRDIVCARCRIEWWYSLKKLVPAQERISPTKTQQTLLTKWADALGCNHVWKETKGNREPNKDEGCGLPTITKLLSSGRFKVVLLWGAIPGRAVGAYKGPVGSMVGRFRTLSEHGDVLATVLHHPIDTLRQRGRPEFAKTESATKEILRQVNDRLEHPAGKDRYPYEIKTSIERVPPRAVVDIETDVPGKSPDPRVDVPRMLCLGDVDSDRVVLTRVDEVQRLVIEPGSRFVMHNAQYDLPLLARLAGHLDFTADDTMVMAYLLGHEQLSLKILARRLLGRHAREFLEKSGPDDHEYDAQDPHLTRDLYHLFRPQIDAKELGFLYDEVKTPLQRIMARHVVQGLRIDQTRVAALHTKMEARTETLRQRLVALVGREFNPRSNDQVASIIFDEIGIPEDRKMGRTTNEVHIGQFREAPFVSTLLAYRKGTGFQSRYTDPLSKIVRVSGLYDLTGTGTDRVSQANRNCMNFPGLVKQCIQADEGGYFVYGDFSQIELRLAAFYSQDPYLLAVIREDRNMHEELCIAVYGARTPETYTQAKSANFAKLFGAGINRRARTLKKPRSVVEANEIPWPGWDAWVARRRYEPASTYWGYERNLDDALESSDEYHREKAYRQVINSIVQGTAGEITQYAMVRAEKLIGELGGRVEHQEHDSVLCFVPDSIPEEEAKEALFIAMHEAVPLEIREVIDIPAKVVVGDHWG